MSESDREYVFVSAIAKLTLENFVLNVKLAQAGYRAIHYRNLGAKANGHPRGMGANDATTKHSDAASRHTWNTAKQDTGTTFAAAHAYLGLYYVQCVVNCFSEDVEADRLHALRAVERAMELARAA